MENLALLDIIIVAVSWFAGGFVHGLSSMGGAMFAVPIMSLWIDMQTTIAVACIVMPFVCFIIAIKFLPYCSKKTALLMVVCAVPGSLIGTFILKYIPPLYLQTLMAVILVTYVIWSLISHQKHKNVLVAKENTLFLAIASFIAGITASSLSFFAPPLAVYILYAGWSPKKTVSTMSLATAILTSITCVFQWFAGIYTSLIINYSLIAIVTALIGVFIAFPIVKHITQQSFKVLLFIILGLSGLSVGIQALIELNIF